MRKLISTLGVIIFFTQVCFSKSFDSDKYSFKLLENKPYTKKTDIYMYQLYKNDEPLRIMNVYVTNSFDGSRILVDFDFNTRNEAVNMAVCSRQNSE